METGQLEEEEYGLFSLLPSRNTQEFNLHFIFMNYTAEERMNILICLRELLIEPTFMFDDGSSTIQFQCSKEGSALGISSLGQGRTRALGASWRWMPECVLQSRPQLGSGFSIYALLVASWAILPHPLL